MANDILLAKSTHESVDIHPEALFNALKSSACHYVHEQESKFIDSLNNAPSIKCSYLNDSRQYPSVKIANENKQIRCKYLRPEFYILSMEGNALLVVQGLYEMSGAIPVIYTTLSTHLFKQSSAEFDAESDMWRKTEA